MGSSASTSSDEEEVDFATSLLMFHQGKRPPTAITRPRRRRGEDEAGRVESDGSVGRQSLASDSIQPQRGQVYGEPSRLDTQQPHQTERLKVAVVEGAGEDEVDGEVRDGEDQVLHDTVERDGSAEPANTLTIHSQEAVHGLESAPPCSAPDASQPQVDDEIEDEEWVVINGPIQDPVYEETICSTGPSALVQVFANTYLSVENLQKALKRHRKEDVNEPHPYDDKQEYGQLAVLHRLALGPYIYQQELLLYLFKFTSVKIDCKTSQGHTAFQLAVEVGNVEVVTTLGALGADPTLPPNYRAAPTRPRSRPTERGASSWAENYSTTWGWITDPVPTQEPEPRPAADNMSSALRDIRAKSASSGTQHCEKHGDSACACAPSTRQHSPSPQTQRKRSRDTELDPEEIPRPKLPPGHTRLTEPHITRLIISSDPDQLTAAEAQGILRQLREELSSPRRNGVRVLCLDGGGIRGLVQLEILRQVEEVLKEYGFKITTFFHYIVGTSTGGIIALALVYGGRSVKELQQLYLSIAKAVFTPVNKVLRANTQKFEGYLKCWLGTKTMNEISRPKLLISGTRNENTHVRLHWFNNFLRGQESTEFVWEVARHTSAAPFHFQYLGHYADGGLIANNPSLSALTTILNHLRHGGSNNEGVSLVVSVGTGTNPPKEYENLQINNYLQYLIRHTRVIKFLFDVGAGSSDACEKAVRCMCREQGIHYVRLNPRLRSEVDPGETDDKELLNMLWTTRKYMAKSGPRHLNKLRTFLHPSSPRPLNT